MLAKDDDTIGVKVIKPRKDLTGQTFGRLTVISQTDKRSKSRRTIWNCICECGNIKQVLGTNLKSGKTKSCGCHRTQIKDLTGQTFGRLTVISQFEKRTKDGCVIWNCTCECGNTKQVSGKSLRSGNTKSCGCLNADQYQSRRVTGLTGQTFGKLTVTSQTDKRAKSGDILWECACECGNVKFVSAHNLKWGLVKSCGCLRSVKDLTGQTFGRLTVTSQTDKRSKDACIVWNCTCECGKTKEVPTNYLTSKSVQSCGCLWRLEDIVGQTFGYLTVIKLTDNRGKKGQAIFECRCICGNIKLAQGSLLIAGKVKSCGCLKVELDKELGKIGEHMLVEGTSLSRLNCKLPKNNTSGTKGVKWEKKQKKWIARIGFQGKHIYLGSYENKADAIQARKEAEEKYFKPILEKYKKSALKTATPKTSTTTI